MEVFFLAMGIFLIGLMLLLLIRAFIGPTVIDRILAVNVIGTKTTILILIIGVIFGRLDMFVDIALAYALLNFIVSLAAARFFERHKIAREVDTVAERHSSP